MLSLSIPKPHLASDSAHPSQFNTYHSNCFFSRLPFPILLIIFILGCQSLPEPIVPDKADAAFPGGNALEIAPDKTPLTIESAPDNSINVTISSTKPDRYDDGCTQLDNLLYQLYKAGDRQSFADQHTLLLTPEGVGVEIQLISADVLLDLSTYQIKVRNQRATLIEAFLPVDQLCRLAENEEVIRISPIRLLQRP